MVRIRMSVPLILGSMLAWGSFGATTPPASGADNCSESDFCAADGCTDYEFVDKQEPFLPELEPFTIETCDWTGEVGMALRYRYLQEDNRLRPGGPGYSSYNQWRWNPRVSLTYRDTITGYIEGIDGSTFNEDLPILPIDENRWDFLQYYVDVKLMELGDGEVHGRYGRQTLLYGDQHVISPLGWANTYRNFEGFKAYYTGDEWKVDAFAVQPVNDAAQGNFPPQQVNTFDQADQSEWVSGIYATYSGLEHGQLDLYWIWDIENEPNPERQTGNRHTFGARYYGQKEITGCGDTPERTWKYDVQGAMQFGEDDFVSGGNDLDVYAGFFNAQLGHTWNNVSMKPTVFALYYLGSGDQDPNDGRDTTYYSLYPLGHAYWGILDNFGGQNLVDYSVGSTISPTEKLTLLSQWHWFDKHRSEDFIYNIAGAPLGPGAAGTQDSHIGTELDLVATYKVNKNLTVQTGYSWFWYGNAVQETALDRGDASQFYFLANYQF